MNTGVYKEPSVPSGTGHRVAVEIPKESIALPCSIP